MSSPAFFNTLTRAQEPFVALTPGKVGIYSCGPTVYGRSHIGNLRAYVFADVLRRTLQGAGYTVTHVMNVTDVGHLVSDADEGEDKMEVGSAREGKSAWDVAARYTELFVRDITALNILPPTEFPRATDHIPEQIAMIVAMEEQGFTYRINDGIYFDTSKLTNYGQLSRQKLQEKEAGARVEVGEKRHATDFALWKFSPAGSQRQMEWESPWGKGFPGWHIECSAMAEKYLGVPFDIHTGGEDHLAVHHENEIAQTFAARGVLEANVWMHNAFLMVDGGKMSKSLGNVYSLDDLAARGIAAPAFRLFLLGAHYRTPLNFTWEAAGAAATALNRLEDACRDLPMPITPAAPAAFVDRLHDDLDTAGALAVLWELIGGGANDPQGTANALSGMDAYVGLGIGDWLGHPVQPSAEAAAIVEKRAQARSNGDFAQSDALRDRLAALGYRVEDTPTGQRLRKAR